MTSGLTGAIYIAAPSVEKVDFTAATKVNAVAVMVKQITGVFKFKLFRIKLINNSYVIESGWLTASQLKYYHKYKTYSIHPFNKN